MASEAAAASGDGPWDLVISRSVRAPLELVYRAWSEGDRLSQWWGPKGCALHVEKSDVRPGGIFLYRMRHGDQDVWGRFVYREVEPPRRLDFVYSYTDETGNAAARAPFSQEWPIEVLDSLTLEEEEGGKDTPTTLMTLRARPLNATEAEAKFFKDIRSNLEQGFGGTFDQLEEYLVRCA